MSTDTYDSRYLMHPNPVARSLLRIITLKKSNLCVSVDLADPEKILSLLDTIGPKICLVKTHIDIIAFDSADSIKSFTMRLTALAKKHSFLIFEDRKFADIGSTVKAQYAGGVYNIASWAHITNAHTVPGPGIIAGLREAAASATTEPRALLLLAEMSSSGNLSGGDYLTRSVQMARENADFVIGFIAMGAVPKVNADEDWIVMTPGVDLGRSGDTLGQQYKTPAMVVRDRGSDVIIVGRGIIAAQDPAERAEAYRVAAWEAYETRVHQI